jgi:hypothetical protein
MWWSTSHSTFDDIPNSHVSAKTIHPTAAPRHHIIQSLEPMAEGNNANVVQMQTGESTPPHVLPLVKMCQTVTTTTRLSTIVIVTVRPASALWLIYCCG